MIFSAKEGISFNKNIYIYIHYLSLSREEVKRRKKALPLLPFVFDRSFAST